MQINRHLATGSHHVHLTIQQSAISGWDIHAELDLALVHVEHHDDWHRVERAMNRLESEVLRHGIRGIAVNC